MTKKTKAKKKTIKDKYNDFKTKYHFFAFCMDKYPRATIFFITFVFLTLLISIVFILKFSYEGEKIKIKDSPIEYKRKTSAD